VKFSFKKLYYIEEATSQNLNAGFRICMEEESCSYFNLYMYIYICVLGKQIIHMKTKLIFCTNDLRYNTFTWNGKL